MKTKLITLACSTALLAASVNSAKADPNNALDVVADVVAVRPACLAATAVGGAFFLVALPFAAISKSVKKTANTLVGVPARATFKRKIGDMESLVES